jgi:hypothetical protein
MTRFARTFVIILAATTVVACGKSNTPAEHGCRPAPSTAGTSHAPGSLPQGGEPVTIDPAAFTTTVTNPYWPLRPGSRWVYREIDTDGKELRVTVTVTDQTKTILGVPVVVVHDLVTAGGERVEDTDDWYAQDAAGNLWYFGEATAEFENGKVSTTEGSWQAGVDGAQPGIALPADPSVGMTYRQEYCGGHAEDNAKVLSVTATTTVPYGAYSDVLQTQESTPLEPGLVEQKFYARGVGPVLTIDVAHPNLRSELHEYQP